MPVVNYTINTIKASICGIWTQSYQWTQSDFKAQFRSFPAKQPEQPGELNWHLDEVYFVTGNLYLRDNAFQAMSDITM